MKRFGCSFVLLCLLVGGSGQARADYIFTTLDGYLAGGINDFGQVVGSYPFPAGSFLYSGGAYTPIIVPTSFLQSQTIASGINNAGQIVGNYNDPGNHGFLRSSSGVYSSFDVPGGFPGTTYAYGINNTGQIVGAYNVGQFGGPPLGFLLSGGNYTTILVPGSTSTWAYGINDHSQIVGTSSIGGFLLSGGSYTTIDVPGSMDTVPFGINNAGEVVGAYSDGHTSHGFLFSEGSYTTIDVPGATFTNINGINTAGEIVGFYGDASGHTYAFLGTPTPEPSSLLLLAVGTVGIAAWTWRRKKGMVRAARRERPNGT